VFHYCATTHDDEIHAWDWSHTLSTAFFKRRYATYSFSGIAGSTYVVKELGSRNAIMAGMALYCGYVGAFWVATVSTAPDWERLAAGMGAVLGGVGAGFLWTAQGAYFAKASEQYAAAAVVASSSSSSSDTDATAKLASIFAFIYLASEVGLRALSTILLGTFNMQWSSIFAIYALVAAGSTVLMVFVHKFEDDATTTTTTDVWYKITAAWQLLRHDRKMKLMLGLNAVFGFTSSFLTSYVNGQVVRQVTEEKYVGLLTAWVSCVAGAMSLVFGRMTLITGKGPILVIGSLCFLAVAFPFLVWPDVSQWSWLPLIFVYSMHGTGRATFEGTLKATFADYFSYEKEGAFANIILQNGLSSALGFVLTITLRCSEKKQEGFGAYCVEYKDGSFHDVLSFELLIVGTAILAILGYWRASALRRDEVARGIYENVPNLIVADSNGRIDE
jgi:Major Facilitator Superfamily